MGSDFCNKGIFVVRKLRKCAARSKQNKAPVAGVYRDRHKGLQKFIPITKVSIFLV
jgi:hypothetical protein